MTSSRGTTFTRSLTSTYSLTIFVNWALKRVRPQEVEKFDYKINAKVNSIDKNAIAYSSVWNEIEDAKFLSSLLNNNIKVRYNKKDIQTGDLFLSKGSMIIYKGDQIIENFEDILFKEAKNFNIKLSSIYSGISISGPDLGSDSVKLIKNKKIWI